MGNGKVSKNELTDILQNQIFGNATQTSGVNSHAEGDTTIASSSASHAEGNNTIASAPNTHAEGEYTRAFSETAHAEGYYTIAGSMDASGLLGIHAEGVATISGNYTRYDGTVNTTYYSANQISLTTTATLSSNKIVIVYKSSTNGVSCLFYADSFTIASTTATTVVLQLPIAYPRNMFSFHGNYTIYGVFIQNSNINTGSHAEGEATSAISNNAHAEGFGTIASGSYSHAEGNKSVASGSASHAEGSITTASGNQAHAEGMSTIASGQYSHTEGGYTKASGDYSHAEGEYAYAYSNIAHAEGWFSLAMHSETVVNVVSVDSTSNTVTVDNLGTLAVNDVVKVMVNDSNGLDITITAIDTANKILTISGYTPSTSWKKIFKKISSTQYPTHVEGYNTVASGSSSHSEGYKTLATGDYSHSEGYNTVASGSGSHSEGASTQATANQSHAEGLNTIASGNSSHAEGYQSKSSGQYSHAEGYQTESSGGNSHVEGEYNTASGTASHAEGTGTASQGYGSHAEGQWGVAQGDYSHVEGNSTYSIGESSHSEGFSTISSGYASHAEGYQTREYGDYGHAEGQGTFVGGYDTYLSSTINASTPTQLVINCGTPLPTLTYPTNILIRYTSTSTNNYNFAQVTMNNQASSSSNSITVNLNTSISDLTYTGTAPNQSASVDVFIPQASTNAVYGAHAEGVATNATSSYSHAEGSKTLTSGYASHAEGGSTTASGMYSHAEGNNTIAKGIYSHAEGYYTTSTGNQSHAEGYGTKASGNSSHAEGYGTVASGSMAHAEGSSTSAITDYSHSEGQYTLAMLSSAVANITAYNTGGQTITVDSLGTFAVNDIVKIYVQNSGAIDVTITAIDSTNKILTVSGSAPASSWKKVLKSSTGQQYPTHAEGYNTLASGGNSHVEGYQTMALGDYSHAEGANTTASGTYSHAEGYNTLASGSYSHAEGNNTTASNSYAHAEGGYTTASGLYAHTEGYNTIASGSYSHAENGMTSAITSYSHAEGQYSIAVHSDTVSSITAYSGQTITVDSLGTFAVNDVVKIYVLNSMFISVTITSIDTTNKILTVSGGTPSSNWKKVLKATTSTQYPTHAEGYQTIASGHSAHAEGYQTTASGAYSHAEGYWSVVTGSYSHAEGFNTTASGNYSHAEGNEAIVSSHYSHAEGLATYAGMYFARLTVATSSSTPTSTITVDTPSNFAVGDSIIIVSNFSSITVSATNRCIISSISGNNLTLTANITATCEINSLVLNLKASTIYGGHAEGMGNVASGHYSHVSGYGNQARYAQTVIGQFCTIPSGSDTAYSSANELFIIGNGTGVGARGNAFKVLGTGAVYADAAYNSTGADYAEYFEWEDGNPNAEDRVGYFVTLDGEMIRKANSTDDYILGVVSSTPSVIGDGYEAWKDKYVTDEWGRVQCHYVTTPEQTETIYHEAELDESGNVVKEAYDEVVVVAPERQDYVPMLNPNWNSDQEYVSREHRPEWSAIGMMGKLLVHDDGTAQAGDYVYPNDEGIATKCERGKGYRVMARMTDSIIKILVK